MTTPDFKILYDVFPAHVAAAAPDAISEPRTLSSKPTTEGAYYIQTARVLVTSTEIIIAQDTPNGATIIFREGYSDSPTQSFFRSATPETDSILITLSGKVVAFKKDTNCGCGSRLRSWNPYKTLYSTKG